LSLPSLPCFFSSLHFKFKFQFQKFFLFLSLYFPLIFFFYFFKWIIDYGFVLTPISITNLDFHVKNTRKCKQPSKNTRFEYRFYVFVIFSCSSCFSLFPGFGLCFSGDAFSDTLYLYKYEKDDAISTTE
ncbi:hypothetical protein LINGRAHAP2_LOCUS7236, partial [Linum grandiflorum]